MLMCGIVLLWVGTLKPGLNLVKYMHFTNQLENVSVCRLKISEKQIETK